MTDVGIVDTGGANLASIRHAVARLGRQVDLIDDPEELERAHHLILPGVGAAGEAMRRLRARGLVEALRSCTRPILGICLGMQLFYETTDEDEVRCIGLFPGRVERLRRAPDRPVPHMGWSRVLATGDSRLLRGLNDGEYFYFVHSYAAPLLDATTGVSSHGPTFTSVVERDNLFGTQFHPERSSTQGARVLKNFLELA